MDSRFPAWLRKTLEKLDFLGIPNLGPLLCGIAVLAFIAQNVANLPMDNYVFDPYLILEGEWWRLITFPVAEPVGSTFWFIFYVMFLYFIAGALEQEWGTGPTTIYFLLGYLSALAGAFITMAPVQVWNYMIKNASFAFGTLFPNYELLLIVIPVKAKWLSLMMAFMLLLEFISSGSSGRIIILCSLFPYFLFFGPYLGKTMIENYKLRKHKKRFSKDMWR